MQASEFKYVLTHPSVLLYLNCPESAITTGQTWRSSKKKQETREQNGRKQKSSFFYYLPWTRVLPDSLPTCSIAETTSWPDITLPKTTCFPSNQGVSAVQIKTNLEQQENFRIISVQTLLEFTLLRLPSLTLTSIGVGTSIRHAESSGTMLIIILKNEHAWKVTRRVSEKEEERYV